MSIVLSSLLLFRNKNRLLYLLATISLALLLSISVASGETVSQLRTSSQVTEGQCFTVTFEDLNQNNSDTAYLTFKRRARGGRLDQDYNPEEYTEVVAVLEIFEDGDYCIESFPAGEYLLEISYPTAPPYEISKLFFAFEEGENNSYKAAIVIASSGIRLVIEKLLDRRTHQMIQLYPNPVERFLHLKLNSRGHLINPNVEIVGMSGKTVLQKKLHSYTKKQETQLDLSILKPGTYLLRITNEYNQIISSQKIIKK